MATKGDDDFVKLCLFHGHRTETSGGSETEIRCNPDYRKYEVRQDDPLLFTAACAEPVSFRAGDRLYCTHGTGVRGLPASTRGSRAQ